MKPEYLRRFMAILASALGLIAVALAHPGPARACLPYEPADNFSFRESLDFAVAGVVVTADASTVSVRVDQVIAGNPASVVTVGPDPEGGCKHPDGAVGDRIVIAAGAPGADYGGFSAWGGDYLSPYNSASWLIATDGSIRSGPTLDGVELGSEGELMAALQSLPSTDLPQPRLQWPAMASTIGAVILTLSVVVLVRRSSPSPPA